MILRFASLTLLGGLTAFAPASLFLTNTPFSGTDSIDWGQFGPSGSGIATPTAGTTTLGSGFLIGAENGDLARVDEGNGWNGYFPGNDKLLWANGTAPVDLTFTSTGYTAVGFLAQQDFYSFPDTFTVTAFDTSFNLIGSVTYTNPTATAGFIGVISTSGLIGEINISASANGGGNPSAQDFSIDTVYLASNTSVPSPAAAIPFGVGLVGLLRRRRNG